MRTTPLSPPQSKQVVADGFSTDTRGCDGNKLYICGSFDSAADGKLVIDLYNKTLAYEDQCKVGVSSDSCSANPGAVIRVKSHDWTAAKTDHTWSYSPQVHRLRPDGGDQVPCHGPLPEQGPRAPPPSLQLPQQGSLPPQDSLQAPVKVLDVSGWIPWSAQATASCAQHGINASRNVIVVCIT